MIKISFDETETDSPLKIVFAFEMYFFRNSFTIVCNQDKLLIALSPLSQIPAIFHQSAGCFDKSIQRPTFCTLHCRSRADVVRGRVQVGKVVCRFYCAVCMSLSYMYKTVTFYILAKDGSLFIKLMALV